MSLDWDEPQTPNGIIDNYIIQFYEDSSPASPSLYNDSVQDTSAVVYNLKAYTNYTFQVSAVTVAEDPFAEGPFAEVSTTTQQSSTYTSIIRNKQCQEILYG